MYLKVYYIQKEKMPMITVKIIGLFNNFISQVFLCRVSIKMKYEKIKILISIFMQVLLSTMMCKPFEPSRHFKLIIQRDTMLTVVYKKCRK